MSRIKETTKTVTKLVETKVEIPNGLNITLTLDEAKVIAMLLRKIGGSPDTSFRGKCYNLTDELSDYFKLDAYCGYPEWYSKLTKSITFHPDRCCMMFKDVPSTKLD